MTELRPSVLNHSEGSIGKGKHERLRNFLLSEIQEGRLKPGAMLSSEYDIARSQGIARNTVRQAMAGLEQDGFIVRIHGKGTFVHEHVQERFQSNSIGLFAFVVPETQRGYYPQLLKSLNLAAEQVHHQIIVCETDDQVDRQGNAILQLIDREVTGVMMVPVITPFAPVFQIRQLQNHGIPVIFLSRRMEGTRAPLIGISFEQAGQLAAKAMFDAGHQDIALLFDSHSVATRGYEAGFRNAVQRLTRPDSVSLRVFYEEPVSPQWTDFHLVAERFLNEAIYHSSRPVTAIFTGHESLAEILYLKLVRAGYRVPDDVSLIGFGASKRHTEFQKQLTSVTVDEHQMARQAVDYLERMRRKELSIQCEDVLSTPLDLYAGASLGQSVVTGVSS